MTRVAIYDSGVGGLSIYQELLAQSASAEYVFVSDNQAYPYGTKAEPELLERVLEVSQAIMLRYKPDLLVMACNTASTVCLPSLRQQYDIPVVGVVPAIKPAAQLSQSGVIGVLATPATIKRPYTNALIKDFASHCEVISKGSAELVDMAERFLNGEPVMTADLVAILQAFIDAQKLDTLVLACTHFPLLKEQIQACFQAQGKHVHLVDSGSAIAKRVDSLLAHLRLSVANENPAQPQNTAAFTHLIKKLDSQFQQNLESLGFACIERLEV